jgi:hypothetical protein
LYRVGVGLATSRQYARAAKLDAYP